MKFQKLFNWLALMTGAVVLGCLIGLGVNSFILNAQAQSDKKIIKLADTFKPQMKFTEIKVGQQEQKFGESFTSEPDWVKNISFKLENTSGKRIVFLSVNVNFPETRSTGNMMSYQVSFGHRPGLPLRGDNAPLLLKPGEILDVSLDKEKERIYKFVNERQSIETINEIELEIAFVIFDDKTGWFAGGFVQQDPGDPRRYNPIENKREQ